MAPQILLRNLESAVNPSPAEEDICSHQTRFLGSKCTKNVFMAEPQHFGVFVAQKTCLVTANVVLFLLKLIYKIKANMAISECTACYDVFLHSISGVF